MPLLRFIAIVAVLVAFSCAAATLRLVGSARGIVLADTFAVLFCRSLLWIIGVRLRIEGDCAQGALILANHVSWMDILAFGSVPSVCFLAKSDVDAWPIISRFARLKGTVFVDRRHRRSILPANAAMTARLAAGRTVVMFPEGTTGAGTTLLRFHSSHVEAVVQARRRGVDAVLQPVTLAYDTPAAAWIGDDALLPHLWRMLRQKPITCTLAFAEPIGVSPEANRKRLTATARAIMSAELVRLRQADGDVPRPAYRQRNWSRAETGGGAGIRAR